MNTIIEVKKNKAKFISIEGGEGSGKSTQIKNLKNWFLRKNIPVCITREPRGSIQSEIIRNLLFKNKKKWDLISEYLLISIARRQNLKEIIWPALAKGKWVVCDRFYDSSIAYQGYAHGLSLNFINNIYREIAGNFKPHLTIFMKIKIRNSISRACERNSHMNKNYYENMEIAFYKKLIKGYSKTINKNSDKYISIDAEQPIKKVWQDIKYNIKNKFNI
jgi:dTMP kinase